MIQVAFEMNFTFFYAHVITAGCLLYKTSVKHTIETNFLTRTLRNEGNTTRFERMFHVLINPKGSILA